MHKYYAITLVIVYLLHFSNAIHFSISEDSRIGYIIGNLTAKGIPSSNLKLLHSNSNDQLFTLNANTGLLRLRSVPDRELICPPTAIILSSMERNCNVKLTVTHGNKYDPQLTTVSIDIIDVNDNTPKFPRPSIDLSVLEGSDPHSSTFNLPIATDPDNSLNGTIGYSLENKDDAPFKLDVINANNLPRLQLRPTRKLDREDGNHYTMKLMAKDHGTGNSLTGTLTINIKVQDENDHAPDFTKSSYDVTIKENVSKGKAILNLTATDKDEGRNSEIRYSLAPETTISVKQYFGVRTLGTKGGELYIRQPLDVDCSSKRLFELTIVATDNADAPKSARAKVTVRVEDVNDYTPHITVSFHNNDDDDKNIGFVEENIERSFIGMVTVKDCDSGKGGEVQCKTTDNRFELESMYSDQSDPELLSQKFKLMAVKSFNREVDLTVQFRIECTDNFNGHPGDVELTGYKDVVVRIRDVNDESPRFNKQYYTFNVRENRPTDGGGKKFVGIVKAIDNDEGKNARIVYSLITNPSRKFEIERNTGKLFVVKSFDRELVPQGVNLTVKAFDGKYSSTTNVHITIIDENDCDPRFGAENYQFSIEEGSRNFTVGMVTATDKDLNQKIFYKLGSKAWRLFKINSHSGTIMVKQPLDRETQSEHKFVVYAVDGVPDKGRRTGSALVTVSVIDVNDNKPQIIKPLQNQEFTVDVDAPLGHRFFKVEAKDMDIDINAKMKFDLEMFDSTLPQLFKIDSTHGYVFLNRKLDSAPVNVDNSNLGGSSHEKGGGRISSNRYRLIVKVTDRAKVEAIPNSRKDPKAFTSSVTVFIGVKPKPLYPSGSEHLGGIGDSYSSMANRTVIIILATIFIILLLTTVILICLIRRRRDIERSKYRATGKSGKCEELSMNISALDSDRERLQDPRTATIGLLGRNDYQTLYSPLRAPLLIGQDGTVLEGHVPGTMDASSGGPGVVFWCQGGSAPNEQTTSKATRQTHPMLDSYQTLDSSFIQTNAGRGGIGGKEMDHLYYEISGNNNGGGKLSSQQMYQTFHASRGDGGADRFDKSRSNNPNKINDARCEQGDSDEDDGCCLESRGGTPGSDLDENSWFASKEAGGGRQTLRHSTRRKEQANFSPYAEASFV